MIERNMIPAPGPSFLRGEDGAVLFQFVLDSCNIIGPRPASRRDQEQHAGAWAAFQRAEGIAALDRDAKAGEGGSLPAEPPPAPESIPTASAALLPPPLELPSVPPRLRRGRPPKR